MNKVRLGDVACERRDNVAGDVSGLAAVGLEHLIPENITLDKCGSAEKSNFTRAFHKGQILFGRRRAYLKKAAVANVDGVCSGDITVIEAKPDRILPELLPFVIQNDRFFDYAVEKSAGSLSPRVKWEHLKNYEFSLPDFDEQRKLADLLWTFTETKNAYQDLIHQTDEMVKSQFIEMFGQPGTDSKGWGITTLDKCCEINPRRPRDMNSELFYSFVPMTAVSEHGDVSVDDKRPYAEVAKGFTYFAENDVLFAKITPCMENGKGGVAQGLENGAGFGSTEFHVLRPIPEKSDPQWLYILTMFEGFRKEAEKVMVGTGGQRRVPLSYFENFKISLPPIELQYEFAKFVEQSDKSKFEMSKTVLNLEAMYKKIISENLG